MIKTITHEKESEEIRLLLLASIPPFYQIIKEEKTSFKIGTNSSTATIKIDGETIIIKGANMIVKDCYLAIKENLENVSDQSLVSRRGMINKNRCNKPICTCGMCDGFFNTK